MRPRAGDPIESLPPVVLIVTGWSTLEGSIPGRILARPGRL